MRYLLFTLLGFFGPALLMLLMRLIWHRIHQRWLKRRNEAEIIDVTPSSQRRPSRLFIATWLVTSLICTGLLIWQMDDTPAAKQVYIPAHMDAEGKFVPAETLKTEKTQMK